MLHFAQSCCHCPGRRGTGLSGQSSVGWDKARDPECYRLELVCCCIWKPWSRLIRRIQRPRVSTVMMLSRPYKRCRPSPPNAFSSLHSNHSHLHHLLSLCLICLSLSLWVPAFLGVFSSLDSASLLLGSSNETTQSRHTFFPSLDETFPFPYQFLELPSSTTRTPPKFARNPPLASPAQPLTSL